MSISAEIERLNASKIAIAQAIRDKGVDIPEDAKIDTLANYIKQLGSALGIAKEFKAYGNKLTCTDTMEGRPFAGLKIYGKSVQDGTPSPENEIPIISSGDSGKISITVSDSTGIGQTVSASTPENLCGIPIGEDRVCDIIDFEAGTISKNIGVYIYTGNERMIQQSGRIAVNTSQKTPETTLGALCNFFSGVVTATGGWSYIPTDKTPEQLSQFMKENEVKLYYICESKTSPISADILSDYRLLFSYDGITQILTAENVTSIVATLYCKSD